MVLYPLKVKTFEDLWRIDKEVLRSYDSNFDINWSSRLPDDKQGHSILVARTRLWQRPKNPINLDERVLRDVVKSLVPSIERLFDQKLEVPEIEIVDTDKYLDRINELTTWINNQLGSGELYKSPPSMAFMPYAERIVIPRKFLASGLKGEQAKDMRGGVSSISIIKGRANVIESEWDLPYFEQVLCEEFSHVMFRQIRGEYGSYYIDTFKRVDGEKENSISFVNESVAQIVKDKLVKEKPEWGLYVVSERILEIWGNRFQRGFYLGCDALLQIKTLKQVSTVDLVNSSPGQNIVTVMFFPEHPNNKDKQRKFD